MSKISEEQLSTVLQIMSKIMHQNTIVLYHLRLKNGTMGLMSANDFDKLLNKFGIKLTEKSCILRVNVDKTAQGYYVKQGSNAPNVFGMYSSIALHPTGTEFNNLVLSVLTNLASKQDSIKALTTWLKRGSFALVIKNGVNFCLVDVSEGKITINNAVGIVRDCNKYILCKDLEFYGLSMKDANIVDYSCKLDAPSSNEFQYKSTKLDIENDGWNLVESYSIGMVRMGLKGIVHIRLQLVRDFSCFYSNLPNRVARELNQRVPKLGFHRIGSIPIEDKVSTAEAMAMLFYLKNKAIYDSCSIGTSTYNEQLSLAMSKGYIRFPRPTVSSKVEKYVTSNFNDINSSLGTTQTKSAQPERKGLFKRLFS